MIIIMPGFSILGWVMLLSLPYVIYKVRKDYKNSERERREAREKHLEAERLEQAEDEKYSRYLLACIEHERRAEDAARKLGFANVDELCRATLAGELRRHMHMSEEEFYEEYNMTEDEYDDLHAIACSRNDYYEVNEAFYPSPAIRRPIK